MVARYPSTGIASGSEASLEAIPHTEPTVIEQLADRSGATWLGVGSTGVDCPVRYWVKRPDAGTIETVGFAAAPTELGAKATADAADMPLIAYLSGSVSGDTAGIQSATVKYVKPGWKPRLVTAMGTGTSIAVCNLWVGLASATLDTIDTPSALHVAAFRYAPAVDGTAFWRTVTCNAAGITTTTTLAPIAVSTTYRLRIDVDAAAVRFWINGDLVATHTTHLPGSTAEMLIRCAIETREAVAKTIRWSHTTLQQGF